MNLAILIHVGSLSASFHLALLNLCDFQASETIGIFGDPDDGLVHEGRRRASEESARSSTALYVQHSLEAMIKIVLDSVAEVFDRVAT